jgi:hypothetical protein
VLMHYGKDSEMLLDDAVDDGLLQFDTVPAHPVAVRKLLAHNTSASANR